MAIYLKLGTLVGSATDKDYPQWIEIESYSWGFSVAVQTTVGSSSNRMSSGKVTPGDLHLTKKMDATTTQFMLMSMQGTNTPQATLAVTMPSKDSSKYMEYLMTNVICSSFNASGQNPGGGAGDVPMESISFNFTKVAFNQYLRAADGSPLPAQRGAYDFTQATQALA